MSLDLANVDRTDVTIMIESTLIHAKNGVQDAPMTTGGCLCGAQKFSAEHMEDHERWTEAETFERS